MKKTVSIILFVFGGFAVKTQIPQPDPDTTALHFLIVASIGNLQEASAGTLAAKKAIRPDVKAFGKMMVMDHQDSETKLLVLAKRKGLQLPEAARDGIQLDLPLKNATTAFDRLYVHAMVVTHANTVLTFENYAMTGKDPDVRAFARQVLPVLRHHLEEIKAIDEKIRGRAAP